MAHTLSHNQFLAIAALDPVVKAQADVCGWNSCYTMDSIVRRYIDKTLVDFLNDTKSQDIESVELEAGIGSLTLTKTGSSFVPLAQAKTEIIHMANADLKASRLITCGKCDRYIKGSCSISGCSCNGMGSPSRLYSKCPMGLWEK
jgi:hypothetical protein